MDRDRVFRIRVTEAERAMLRELAEERGVTSADVLRLAIRREHRETFGEKEIQTPLGIEGRCASE